MLVPLSLISAFFVTTASGTEFTHDRKRVGPADVVNAEHGCLEQFKVRENSIIRTKDSKQLGAKFLNESDVGNREDCLNLCCMTEFCNVAIFQETKPFSCFLFDCGTSDDLRCRFTGHTYYTSAMLKINRHQLDLGLWSTQRQHESELSDLRIHSTTIDKSPPKEVIPNTEVQLNPKQDLPTTLPPSTVPTTLPPKVPSTQSRNTQSDSRKCHRFEFECHSGECIAIYNACDGIPQCRDGSDEGPDLACPHNSAQLQEGETSPSRAVQKTDGMDFKPNPSFVGWKPKNNILNNKGDSYSQRSSLLEYNNRNYVPGLSSDYTQDDILNHNDVSPKNPTSYYDFGQRGRQGSLDAVDTGSSMFHHDYPEYGFGSRQKALHQPLEPQSQQIQQPLYQRSMQQQYQQNPPWQNTNQRYSYPIQQTPQQNSPELLPNPKTQLNSPRRQQTDISPYLAQGGRSRPLHGGPIEESIIPQQRQSSYLPNEESQNSLQQNNLPLQPSLNSTLYKQPNPSQQSLGQTVNQKQNNAPSNSTSATNQSVEPQIQTSPTSGSNRAKEDPSAIVKSKESKKNIDKSVSHTSMSRLEVDLRELLDKDKEQSAQASGAVLALSLGVCITALLLVLVGCRMKNVKRRMRRHRGGRSPLEHDADYLVNGMYL